MVVDDNLSLTLAVCFYQGYQMTNNCWAQLNHWVNNFLLPLFDTIFELQKTAGHMDHMEFFIPQKCVHFVTTEVRGEL